MHDYLVKVHDICAKGECSVDVVGVLLAPVPDALVSERLGDADVKLLEGIIDSQAQYLRMPGYSARGRALCETALRSVKCHCTFEGSASYEVIAQLLARIPLDCILETDFVAWMGEDRLSKCIASAVKSYLDGNSALNVRPHVFMWCLLKDPASISRASFLSIASSLEGAYSQSYAATDRKMRALALLVEILCMLCPRAQNFAQQSHSFLTTICQKRGLE